MKLDVRINGEPAELSVDGIVDWESLVASLDEALGECGWLVESLHLDGHEVAAGSTPVFDEGSHRIDVIAVPERAALERSLTETLPRFSAMAENLGQRFARGHWRGALEDLLQCLEELQVVLSGYEALATVPASAPELVRRVPDMLPVLKAAIENQSWVEVSDILLYELVPLLETRESSTSEE